MFDNDYELIENLEKALKDESVSPETSAKIVGKFREIWKENDDLRRRLTWLEDTIDEEDQEDLYTRYQKEFGITHWSGEQD